MYKLCHLVPTSLLNPHHFTQIPVVLLPPRLSKAAPFESFLLAHFPEAMLSPASSLPFSKICWTTSTSACVENTLSSSCFEGRRKRPCGPWFEERISNAVIDLRWGNIWSGSQRSRTINYVDQGDGSMEIILSVCTSVKRKRYERNPTCLKAPVLNELSGHWVREYLPPSFHFLY